MGGRARLPDEAFVVRCGLPPFENSVLHEDCRRHPDGPYGFLVQAAAAMSVEQLATACSNRSVGFTTAWEIRRMGYEVVSTGAPHHATVVVPEGWGVDPASALALIFRHAIKPAPNKPRRR